MTERDVIDETAKPWKLADGVSMNADVVIIIVGKDIRCMDCLKHVTIGLVDIAKCYVILYR